MTTNVDGRAQTNSGKAAGEFRYSRKTTLVYLVASGVLAAVTAARVHASPAAAPVWLPFGFVGAAIGFAVLAVRPRRLVVDDEGFSISGGFSWRSQRIRWREVDRFVVCSPGRGSRAVGVQFKRPERDYVHLADDRPAVRATLVLQGWDETPEAMASELNRLREQAHGGTI